MENGGQQTEEDPNYQMTMQWHYIFLCVCVLVASLSRILLRVKTDRLVSLLILLAEWDTESAAEIFHLASPMQMAFE